MDREAYHRFTFNVSLQHSARVAVDLLKFAQYRTTPILQLMQIIQGPVKREVKPIPQKQIVTKKRKAEVLYIDSSSENEDGPSGSSRSSKTALLEK